MRGCLPDNLSSLILFLYSGLKGSTGLSDIQDIMCRAFLAANDIDDIGAVTRKSMPHGEATLGSRYLRIFVQIVTGTTAGLLQERVPCETG